MTVWTIDGKVEAAERLLKNNRFVVFKAVTFRDSAGVETTINKLMAAGPVAESLTPGASGRFYLAKALDQTGVHGVRLDDGKTLYAPYTNMELLAQIASGAGGLVLLMALFGARGILLTPILVLPLGLVLWWLARKARLEGKAQFDGDARPAAAVAAT